MAYLNKIIATINKALQSKLSAFPTAKFNGVAYQIPLDGSKSPKVAPAIISNNGEAVFMGFDDVNELTIYHRIISSSYSQERSKSYGDAYSSFNHNYDIDLIVMADRTKIEVSADILEIAIASNLPDTDKVEGFNYVNIYPISANHNNRAVFTQEFQNIPYYLKPEHILFSIRYRIEMKYMKGCISLCQCD